MYNRKALLINRLVEVASSRWLNYLVDVTFSRSLGSVIYYFDFSMGEILGSGKKGILRMLIPFELRFEFHFELRFEFRFKLRF